MTYAEALLNMNPGDSISVYFPKGFKLEMITYDHRKKTFICEKMNSHFFDESSNDSKDSYFYESCKSHYTCRMCSLTEESILKIYEYLQNLEYLL